MVATQDRRTADRELAARCAAGERAAQRVLFAQVKQAVHRTLYRILGANRDVEDLVQEAFLSIFRSIESFRGESNLTTWCCTISTRVAWAYIERRKPAAASLELVPEMASSDPGAERVVYARQAAQRVYAALDRIEPKLRIAFALAVIDGRSLAEVAELTDASVVAVKARVWRARRELEKRARKDDILSAFLDGAVAQEEAHDE